MSLESQPLESQTPDISSDYKKATKHLDIDTSSKTANIWFITGNVGKIHEAKYAISDINFAGSMNYNMTEIQSNDYNDIITEKAKSFIDEITKNWPTDKNEILAIVEDTGLECANMNGFPGPYIRYYFDKLGLPGICNFNGGFAATFVSHSAAVYIRREIMEDLAPIFSHEIKIFEVRAEGLITDCPRGQKGFGFDPIFTPLSNPNITLAELDLADKQLCSARMQSIRQARDYLFTIKYEI